MFVQKIYNFIVPKLNTLLIILGIFSSLYLFVDFYDKVVEERPFEFMVLVLLPIAITVSIKPVIKMISINKHLILLIPLSMLNFVEYIYVERLMSPNHSFDHLMIVINNVVTCMLVIESTKSIINFTVKSFDDCILDLSEILIIVPSFIVFAATLLRTFFNFGMFINWNLSGELIKIKTNNIIDPIVYHDMDYSTNDCNQQKIDHRNCFGVILGGIYRAVLDRCAHHDFVPF